MGKKIIAWDLGTSGNKASLYDTDGACISDAFISYNTSYPAHGWHEQRPNDWWDAVVKSTRLLLEKSGTAKEDVCCCGISGHSLVPVLIGRDGELLKDSVPIWSDGRAFKQAEKVFSGFDEEYWYMKTGNGFTPAFYTAFKLLWYRENEPGIFGGISKFIGSKDYINYRLTGRICSDPSYSSGCGMWDLVKWDYSQELIDAMGLDRSIFPEVVASTDVIGSVKPEAAEALGLHKGVQVVAGGVDNACMALGAKAFKEGRVYNNLGSSAWIAVSSQKPLLDKKSRPYVFTHVVPGYYASALCVTTGGTAFRWMRDTLCKDLKEEAKKTGADEYELMTKEALKSPVGANRLLFNPSLGGGMPMDRSYNLRGSFMGLDLVHTRSDMLRASMEGISLSLRVCLDKMRELAGISDEMLLVGGGSKSPEWRQIYADIYGTTVLKSNVDQQASALGAAACAAVGTGLWSGFDRIDSLHTIEERVEPVPENAAFYDRLMEIYNHASSCLSDIGDSLIKMTPPSKG
jgi:xylulokinase